MTDRKSYGVGAGRSIVAAAIAGLLVSGCAFRTQATGMAVDYNDFIATTTNRQTVLNVLRASRREPMHFTSFSEVVGTVRGTGSLGVTVASNGDSGSLTRTDTTVENTTAAGGATGGSATAAIANLAARGATNVTPNLALTVATGTDFKIAANATDEFYKGILNPITSATIVNYLRQGFPADLLSHLVVGRLEYSASITAPDGTRSLEPMMTVENHPGNADEIRDFDAAIRCRKLDYLANSTPRRQLEAATIAEFGQLTVDQLVRVEAISNAGGVVSYRLNWPEKNDFSLAMSEPDDGECGTTRRELVARIGSWIKERGLTARQSAASPTFSRAKLREFSRPDREDEGRRRDRIEASGVQLGSKGYFTPYLPDGYSGDLVIDLTLRSVEGVIYYLGEYVRADTPPVLLKGGDTCRDYCLPILRVRPASSIKAPDRFVEVEYRGIGYAVPLSGEELNAGAGRSSQVVGLVQQLLNLNRSAKDLPSTPLVRVYN